MVTAFDPVEILFSGARRDVALGEAHVALFGAPHGTPYPGIDNTGYAPAPDALRLALGRSLGFRSGRAAAERP